MSSPSCSTLTLDKQIQTQAQGRLDVMKYAQLALIALSILLGSGYIARALLAG